METYSWKHIRRNTFEFLILSTKNQNIAQDRKSCITQ